jgi:class 3 adenylate cyclase
MLNLIPQFIVAEYEMGRLSGEFEAASLFMDISGFTKLTKSLMQHGKSGAESLTLVLNRCLSFPVQVVHEHGGFITHFVGDGFVALFPDEAGVSGAVQSAEIIQNFIQENGLVHTRHIDHALKVKINLGWGDVTWNLIGQGEHLTYSFAGTAITTGVDVEKEKRKAHSDGIIKAPELEAQLADAKNAEGSRLSFSNMTPSPELLARFGLTPIHPEINAEFRSVATVFIALGKEPSIDELKSFVNQALNLAAQYGGYFNKLEYADKGYVMLVVFGAPISQENNLKHAADFLVEIESLPTAINWQAGSPRGGSMLDWWVAMSVTNTPSLEKRSIWHPV